MRFPRTIFRQNNYRSRLQEYLYLMEKRRGSIPPPPEPFDPIILFRHGQQGLFIDPSDLSTMFQDAAGTIPVTSNGDLVCLIKDKSGNNNHALRNTIAAQFKYRTDGALHWLEADGFDDSMQTDNIDFSVSNEIAIIIGQQKLKDAAPGILLEHSANANNNNGTFGINAPRNASDTGYMMVSKGTLVGAATSAAAPAPNTAIVSGVARINPPKITIRTNGAISEDNRDQGIGNYGNYPLYIGRRGGTTLPYGGKIYGIIIRGGPITNTELIETERWMARKAGIAL